MLKSTVALSCTERYPCLKRSKETGTIVLFSEKGIGIVVGKGTAQKVGFFLGGWDESKFEDFYGSVTLSEIK